jgi:hypothetical protein
VERVTDHGYSPLPEGARQAETERQGRKDRQARSSKARAKATLAAELRDLEEQRGLQARLKAEFEARDAGRSC